MAERQTPSSRGSGERRPPSSRDRDEYQQPVSQSRDGYRQPAPQSRDGYRQPTAQSRDGYRQPAPQSRDGYRQPTAQSRDGYRQPTSQSRDGYRQPTPQSRDGYRQPTAQSRDGYRQPTPQSRDGYRQPAPQSRDGYRQPASQSRSDDRPRRQSSRRSDVIRCENCGEDYSVTYKRCPFCDERPSRGGISGKRVANTRGGGYGRPASALKTATWIASFVVVIAAMVIIYRFMGAPLFGGNRDPDSSASGSQNSGASTSTADPVTPGNPGGNTSNPPAAPAVESIALSQDDITIDANGSAQLTASLLPAGAEGEITWSSSDESVATVDAAGNVTNVNAGSSNAKVTITASCGSVTAQATVYCQPSGGGTTPAGGQQGRVVNAEKGVNIRSGPGTDYDKVASVQNGSTVTVLGEEDGWYKVSYRSGKTGHIRKDFISIG